MYKYSMQTFEEWRILKEASTGYVLANEGRRNMEKLQNRTKTTDTSLFGEPDDDHNWSPGINDPASKGSCPITPLSGYETHIKAIQSYAAASPENFAQVLMFSPLSANVSFPKHWDNYHVLMMILKHYFPKRVSREELEQAIDSFGEYLHSMPHTVHGFKLDTVVYVWNNREKLKQELTSLAKAGNDGALIQSLCQIPGAQPVKAGFIAQLLFGKAGCIDTHNIDIYGKAFPDLKKDLNTDDWKGPEGTANYMKVLDKLQNRGIGTKQLWDVWVDFVENFYKQISSHGRGAYTDMGTAIDNPNHPDYDPLKSVEIPKMGATRGGKMVFVKPVSGKMGMGASATHLPLDPDDALSQFHAMYDKGEPGSDAARSVPFRTDSLGRPIDTHVGLGTQPSLLKYFRSALTGDRKVDDEIVKRIIRDRIMTGGKKARKARGDAAQGNLF